MNTALSNLKILDFTTLLPGPYATLMLADMGAEVLRISSKSRPDLVSDMGTFDEELNRSATHMWLHRNKQTMSLNLKASESIEIIKQLLQEYDILVEQFRPGIMDKLGLSYEELKKINPRLIYCSITGYGHSGPDMNRAAHDINFVARSGLYSLSGRKHEGPTLMHTQIGDIAGGALHATIAILAAVNYRQLTGKGQFLDISMLDTLIPLNTMEGISYLMDGQKREREGYSLNGQGIYDLYETSDREYLAIASLEPKFLKKLADVINLPELYEAGATPNDGGILKNKLKEIIQSKPLSYWKPLFEPLDACIEPVATFQYAFKEDPQIQAREMIVPVNAGSKSVPQFALPIKFSESEVHYHFAGKEVGADTHHVLKQLGYSDEVIQLMEEKGCFE